MEGLRNNLVGGVTDHKQSLLVLFNVAVGIIFLIELFCDQAKLCFAKKESSLWGIVTFA